MADNNVERRRKDEKEAGTRENGGGAAYGHTHSHDHGNDHGHTHTHGHDHAHGHDHEHEQHSPEETMALLAYMVTHTQHHAEELHELAHSVEGEAAQLLHEAVVDLTVGNEKLAEALRILKGEE